MRGGEREILRFSRTDRADGAHGTAWRAQMGAGKSWGAAHRPWRGASRASPAELQSQQSQPATAIAHEAPSCTRLVVPGHIIHALAQSEQPAPAPGCQGMSCGLLGGRFAIRSAPGPLADAAEERPHPRGSVNRHSAEQPTALLRGSAAGSAKCSSTRLYVRVQA